jgi:hypothetical protein
VYFSLTTVIAVGSVCISVCDRIKSTRRSGPRNEENIK